jgi:putative Ca2+/H+ antiporter (TMEM165/GDT1 family)
MAADFPEIAAITDYTSLVTAIAAAREYRQISCETVELIAGLTKGHCSKLLAESREKKIGPTTLGLLLQALGVKLLMVPDERQEQLMRGRWERRNSDQIRVRSPEISQALFELAKKAYLSEIGRKGAIATNKLIAERRQARRNGNGHAKT